MCGHPQGSRQIGKHIYGEGKYHIIEVCALCGINVRGEGTFVPQSDPAVRGGHDRLPVLRDSAKRGERQDQPSLFGE